MFSESSYEFSWFSRFFKIVSTFEGIFGLKSILRKTSDILSWTAHNYSDLWSIAQNTTAIYVRIWRFYILNNRLYTVSVFSTVPYPYVVYFRQLWALGIVSGFCLSHLVFLDLSTVLETRTTYGPKCAIAFLKSLPSKKSKPLKIEWIPSKSFKFVRKPPQNAR